MIFNRLTDSQPGRAYAPPAIADKDEPLEKPNGLTLGEPTSDEDERK